MAERRLPRGLLDPESQAIAEAYEAIPSVRRQTRGLLSLDPQEEQGMGQTAIEMLASFIPGVGQLLAGRDIERARRAGDPAAAAMAATEFLPFGRLAGMMRRPGPIMSEIDVYHGSPHRFEEFDASKIGTGEGAQAYGHGIYLAESPDVAKEYATRLWKNKYPAGRAEAWEASSNFYKAQEKYLQSVLDGAPKETQQALKKNMDLALEGISQAKREVGPQFYTADLPDEMVDRMLDWDKRISDQPEFVKAAWQSWQKSKEAQKLKKQLMNQGRSQAEVEKMFANPTGQTMHGWIYEGYGSAKGGEKPKVAKFLQSQGVLGVKYQDAGSRGQGGSGTRNFVVFPGEEKKVKILKRE